MWLYIKDGTNLKCSIVESFCSLNFVGKKRGWGYTGVLTTQIMSGKKTQRQHKGKGCVSEIHSIAKAEEIAGTHRKDSE